MKNRHYHKTQQEKDREQAELIAFEQSIEAKTILAIETEIEKYDAEISLLTKKIHDGSHRSYLDIKALRKRRKICKKEREKLKMKLDFLKK